MESGRRKCASEGRQRRRPHGVTVMHCRRAFHIVAIASALASGGCLRRTETIRVFPDGSVSISLEYRGKPDVWKTHDALPSSPGGWAPTESTEKDGNEVTKVVRAERHFAAGEPLPGTFAAPDDPDEDLYLRFPTTLTREQRGNLTCYHLRRTYGARPWAFIQIWHDAAFSGNVENLAKKKTEELTRQDRAELLLAFARFESMKQLEYARGAWQKAMPAAPQDHWLMARKALLDSYEEINFDDLAGLLETAADQNGALAREAERIVQRGYERFVESARARGYTPIELEVFRKEYARAKKAYEITEQVSSHSFEIIVKMPGRVIGHNGDRTGDDDSVIWEFSGEFFRDRPHEILVSSCVDRAADQADRP